MYLSTVGAYTGGHQESTLFTKKVIPSPEKLYTEHPITTPFSLHHLIVMRYLDARTRNFQSLPIHLAKSTSKRISARSKRSDPVDDQFSTATSKCVADRCLDRAVANDLTLLSCDRPIEHTVWARQVGLWAVDDYGVARQDDVVKQIQSCRLEPFQALSSLELVSRLGLFCVQDQEKTTEIFQCCLASTKHGSCRDSRLAASQRWALAFWRRDTRPAIHSSYLDRGLETRENLTRKVRVPASPST
jgi:hypothetical protein